MNEPLAPTGFLPKGYQSVAEQLQENAARLPTEPALISIEDDAILTWQQLYSITTKLGYWLRDKGITANDRIAVLGENSLELLILYYGIQAYGATYCTINTEVNPHHLQEMLDRIQPKLVFVDYNLDRKILNLCKPENLWVFKSFAEDEGFFTELVDRPNSPVLEALNEPEDRSVISFTSGTSAQPKGVLHCFSNYYAIAQHQQERWSLTEHDRVLEFRSFSWASAHMLSLNSILLTGAKLVFAKRYSRSRFLGWVEQYNPTVIVAVPTVINLLLEEPPKNPKLAFRGVRFISCSTAPLMPDQHRRFENTYGIPLVQLYGMSEGGVVCANYPENRRIGSVGKPGLYHEISIKDSDGVNLAAGEIGEIETLSAQHAQAYLHAGGNLEIIRGLPLKTGDMGYVDEDGYVHVTGRARDVIIRGGVNISPLEIDTILSEHPSVSEAATFGIPDSVYGEEIASFVTLNPNGSTSIKDLADHCAKALPKFKRPKQIEIVSKIPKNDRGKIDRNATSKIWQEQYSPLS